MLSLCSFASTENYLILVLAPCVLQPLKMLINKNVFSSVQWKPQIGVKFYVVDKRKNGPGHVATYRSASHCPFSCMLTRLQYKMASNSMLWTKERWHRS